jgi:7,8-dihydropterin-6-yl-methyl-4-(beta-D-ribofuranosyl)aminobenzene 5'-phosphate synthase
MLRITILCDNVVGFPFGIGEHGFSALVEVDGEAILFDAGSGKGIIPNTMTFGKDLRAVKKICISHGHFDHTEGLPQVLPLMQSPDVHAHPGVFQERIGERKLGETVVRRFIGIPYRREYLEYLGARFRLECGFREIARDVFLTGEVPRYSIFEKGDANLLLPHAGSFVQDPILDDQSLVIRTSQGLVVLFGCAHSGMINILDHARKKTGEERIHAVLGGTHLGFLSPEQLAASIQELKTMDPHVVGVSHCTGMKPAVRMWQEFGERFSFAHVGSSFQFE